MNELVQIVLSILSGVAAIITIIFTDYGAIRGKYRADWSDFIRSLLSFAALAAFFLATILFSDRQVLLRWSSHAYLFIAALTYFGAGIVLWSGTFNRFQHFVFYALVIFNIIYSSVLMYFSDEPALVPEEVIGIYGGAVLFQILLACERFAYSKVGYPLRETVESLRQRVRTRVLEGTSSSSEPQRTAAYASSGGVFSSQVWAKQYSDVEAWSRFLGYSFFGATSYTFLMVISGIM